MTFRCPIRRNSKCPSIDASLRGLRHSGQRRFNGKGNENAMSEACLCFAALFPIPVSIEIEPLRTNERRSGIFRVNVVGSHLFPPSGQERGMSGSGLGRRNRSIPVECERLPQRLRHRSRSERGKHNNQKNALSEHKTLNNPIPADLRHDWE